MRSSSRSVLHVFIGLPRLLLLMDLEDSSYRNCNLLMEVFADSAPNSWTDLMFELNRSILMIVVTKLHWLCVGRDDLRSSEGELGGRLRQ